MRPVGLGWRDAWAAEAFESPALVDHYELITDNLLVTQGPRRAQARRLRELRPVYLHGLSLDVAGLDAIDWSLVDQVAQLAQELQPGFVSDHLCFTRLDGRHTYELLPAPFTQTHLVHTRARVDALQERLGRVLVLENVSSYVRYQEDELDEATFTAELLRRTGCKLLLDLNNLHVNACNHRFDSTVFLERLPADSVAGYHLAGHQQRDDAAGERFLFDTHDAPVSEAVWGLFSKAVERFGAQPVTLEWDDKLPPFRQAVAEARQARGQ